MVTTKYFRLHLTALLSCLLLAACATRDRDAGFVQLFDGTSLKGWQVLGNTNGWAAANGLLVAQRGKTGPLLSERTYSDFVFRFEFRLGEGGNNGVAIRAPMTGPLSTEGMEIQILDDEATKYDKLRPAQYHGSLYGVVPATRGSLRPVGEWNSQEVTAIGRKIKVVVNGKVVVDADLNEITDPEILAKHPGILRERGHVGFLGHEDQVEFRNVRIRELRDPARLGSPLAKINTPPPGFVPLFNGTDLTGWKGLVADPIKRAKMSPTELAAQQAKADQFMREHWKVSNGTLVFDGKGHNLCTVKDYGDFELLVDWKTQEKGDTGIYLRGSPQVNIWDDPIGSGGLYNNQKNPSKPRTRADRFVGEWNRFRILMIGEKVTVFLNDELVTHNVTMENYWDRNRPIFPTGAIELQNHGNPLWFRNIYIRELKP